MFRTDINGLRAIAVIAVVIFHFQPAWLKGGFAGVDVFFVISGFLMTKIIFSSFEQDKFSILKFYLARINRIIPALVFLCAVLMLLGMLFLMPNEYAELSKHVVSSLGFFSNFVYWSESGYFESSSNEKWLLHTWSLSVEWQFYLIYPLVLVFLRKLMSLNTLKVLILIGAVASFGLCIFITLKSPSVSYFLLPARVWEMLIGGIAYLYPIHFLEKSKKLIQPLGLLLIVGSYLFISETTPWPGYFALFPVIGAFLVIQSQYNNSIVTGNPIFQKLGAWSYSIYLWHWPFVVAINYFALPMYWIAIGISLSLLLGFLSYQFIEKINFKNSFSFKNMIFKCKPILMIYLLGIISVLFYKTEGAYALSAEKLLSISRNIASSPYRDKCHTGGSSYLKPEHACTYFNDNITWAVFGDSHTVEISYALGKELDKIGEGVKHLSFSGCPPSFGQTISYGNCTQWTAEAIDALVQDEKIQNIVVGYRLTSALFGEQLFHYPDLPPINSSDDLKRQSVISSLNWIIKELSSKKKNIFILKPIPELGAPINKLLRDNHLNGNSVVDVVGTSREYFLKRNKFVLDYFDNTDFASNVKFIDPSTVNCDNNTCWAVSGGIPFYFDDDHLSIIGALSVAQQIVDEYKDI
jgi:peptidoglycan/LPS O-acetylase OafA/YrhL